MRALIVDDSRFVRGFLRGLLEERGIACAEAGDGQGGLVQLQSGVDFDLALIDWNMPVMDGLEMLDYSACPGLQGSQGHDGDNRGRE